MAGQLISRSAERWTQRYIIVVVVDLQKGFLFPESYSTSTEIYCSYSHVVNVVQSVQEIVQRVNCSTIRVGGGTRCLGWNSCLFRGSPARRTSSSSSRPTIVVAVASVGICNGEKP